MKLSDIKYDGVDDAEAILEDVMHRRRWSSGDRDAMAEALSKIVLREHKKMHRRRAAGWGK